MDKCQLWFRTEPDESEMCGRDSVGEVDGRFYCKEHLDYALREFEKRKQTEDQAVTVSRFVPSAVVP